MDNNGRLCRSGDALTYQRVFQNKTSSLGNVEVAESRYDYVIHSVNVFSKESSMTDGSELSFDFVSAQKPT